MAAFSKRIYTFPALIGWPGGLGLALLGAAGILAVMLLQPVQVQNSALNTEISKLNALLRQPLNTTSAAEVRQKLDDFVKTLPAQYELNTTLNLLHELAARHHLSLKNSDYRPMQNKSDSIRRMHITVKTEGSYADVRGFLREIPEALPALAIEQFSLSRQKISDTRLETVVEFTLYYSHTDVKLN
jgi:Tfp pilus assembly protein PilO